MCLLCATCHIHTKWDLNLASTMTSGVNGCQPSVPGTILCHSYMMDDCVILLKQNITTREYGEYKDVHMICHKIYVCHTCQDTPQFHLWSL